MTKKKKMKFVFGRVDNIVGKKRICWFPAFSPFPTMFSRAFFYFKVARSEFCGKGLSNMLNVVYVYPPENMSSMILLYTK